MLMKAEQRHNSLFRSSCVDVGQAAGVWALVPGRVHPHQAGPLWQGSWCRSAHNGADSRWSTLRCWEGQKEVAPAAPACQVGPFWISVGSAGA